MGDDLKIDSILRQDTMQQINWTAKSHAIDTDANSTGLKKALQKSDEYYKNTCTSMEKDANESSINAVAFSKKRGIVSFFLDLFGWKKDAPEAAKNQESPNKVDPASNRPKLEAPEESAKRLNYYLEQTRNSTLERIKGIDEEFSSKDPKKGDALIMAILVALINQSRKNRELDGLFAAEQVRDFQETIAEAQKRKSEIYEQMNKLAKNSAFYAKIEPIFQAGAMVGAVLTGVTVITGAATMASGGTLAPVMAAIGIFTGISTGLGALNGFMRNWNNIDFEKHQGASLKINEEKNILQFEIRLTMDQLKQAMKDVSANVENLTKTLEMLQENQAMFK